MANNSKISVNIPISRYVQGGTTDVYTNRLGWWDRRSFVRDPNEIVFNITAQYAGRPDLISQRAYGTVNYQWLVLLYNNIVDIEEELIVNEQIKLPSFRALTQDIANRPIGGRRVT